MTQSVTWLPFSFSAMAFRSTSTMATSCSGVKAARSF